MNVLVITSHPYPENSVIIKTMQDALSPLPNVTVRNLESLYGHDTNSIDVAAEQAAYEGVDRVIFMFPIHWFNLTSMLKAYLNSVWSYGWAFGNGGSALVGKSLQVVTSAGASEHTYSATGLIESTMEQVLTPLKASALYVGMNYEPHIALFEAMGASSDHIDSFKSKVIESITA